jgi:hypothetical protein
MFFRAAALTALAMVASVGEASAQTTETPAVHAPAAASPFAGSLATEPAPPAPPPTSPAPIKDPSPMPVAESDPAAPSTISTAPAKDQLQPPQAAALDQKRGPRRFAGTQLFQQLSASTSTLIRSQQQSYNPTVEAATFLLPRYTFADWQLRGRLVFNYEITNSDSTVTRNEPRFSDTTVQLFYRSLPTLAGFQPLVGAQIIAPTSPESRARRMYFSPGIVAQLSRPVHHVLGGELLLLGSVTYQHPIYRYTTPETRDETPYRFVCYGGGSGCDGQLTGITNASDIVSWSVLVAGEWGRWSPALFALGTHQFAYAARGIAGLPNASDRSNVRQTTYFSAWLDYNANTWFTAEVGYYMFRNVLSGDGRYGNPFFDRYQDARFYVGFNVNIDNFVKEIVEKDEGDDSGIVRARNRFGPVTATF